MTIRQTCAYLCLATGLLLITVGPVLAEQSKSGNQAQSGKGDASRNADGLTEGVKPSGKPKTAQEVTKPDASKTNPGKGSASGGDSSRESETGSMGSTSGKNSSGSGY